MSETESAASLPRGPWLCVLTGASRGFGAAFAELLSAEILGPGSLLLLSARSLEPLRLLAHRLLAQRHGGPPQEPGGQGCVGGEPREERGPQEEKGSLLVSCPGGCLRLLCVAADLEGPEGLQALEAALRTQEPGRYRRLLVLNNAGSLGDVSRRVRDVTTAEWAPLCRHLQLNVAAPLLLAAAALRWFQGLEEAEGTGGDEGPSGRVAMVINVSSLCAITPYPSWAPYCSSRAARDMLHVVVATEEPHVRVLNYAPGPMDTDMQAEACVQTGDAGLRGRLEKSRAAGTLVDPRDSARALLRLLRADSFRSGAHVDYYDVPGPRREGDGAETARRGREGGTPQGQ
ncbi:sepiapterin reductase-like [Lethenteron reissneri]|uniref:sepiapterin reductase-like n=1 Tax=Lethenteron reissneri TaxID=7753 RepID=UPI002AB618D8|nr:sepiapterin reductase-like [Lethenteron reissneri]